MAWNAKAARKILLATMRSWREDAKHLADNLEDYSSSEEEFVLGLFQGVGLDREEIFNFAAELSGDSPEAVAARWPQF